MHGNSEHEKPCLLVNSTVKLHHASCTMNLVMLEVATFRPTVKYRAGRTRKVQLVLSQVPKRDIAHGCR